MRNNYTLEENPVDAPATRTVAVSPHNTNELVDIPKALYVGTGGNVEITGVDDINPIVWYNVPSGAILPIRARLVRAAGTTATNIIALY
jgi:hypothetical protein